MLGRVADADPITDTERAVYGPITAVDLHAFLSRWTSDELGSPIADVRFRAGRIDVVWGVELVDGRSAVIKTHRPSVDLEALRTAVAAPRLLADRGFPCAEPIAGRRSGAAAGCPLPRTPHCSCATPTTPAAAPLDRAERHTVAGATG
jgi:hypothetical protein